MGQTLACIPCAADHKKDEKNTLEQLFNDRLAMPVKLRSTFSQEIFMAMSVLRDSP
jgi:hypothetical protein